MSPACADHFSPLHPRQEAAQPLAAPSHSLPLFFLQAHQDAAAECKNATQPSLASGAGASDLAVFHIKV